MPFHLVRSMSGREHFIGKAGADVTLKVTAPAGDECRVLHIQYATDPVDSEPPLICRVREGRESLFVLVEARQAGALLNLVEVAGDGSEQVLDPFFFDPLNPARGYIIRGE
jgi:hypothetical protein